MIRLEHSYFRGFLAVTKKIKYVTQSCLTGTQCHVRSALLSYTTLLSGLNVKYLVFLFLKTFLIIPLFKFVYFEDQFSIVPLISIVYFLFTEPNAPPFNVQGDSTSSTSVLVQWNNVPAADQNGVILSYTVTYKALPDGSPQIKVVSAPVSEATLTGLNEYTNYSITVFASTIKGGGRISAPIFVITDEDSKFTCAFV